MGISSRLLMSTLSRLAHSHDVTDKRIPLSKAQRYQVSTTAQNTKTIPTLNDFSMWAGLCCEG